MRFFPTCVVDTVAADVGKAAVTVLRRAGHDVEVPAGATCCGQPAWNAGYAEEAAQVARTTLDALAGPDGDDAPVCVPAGSCATMIKVFWPELFHLVGDEAASHKAAALAERITEFSSLLAGSTTTTAEPAPSEPTTKVAYHHSCHMLRELGIHDEPLALLAAAGCEVVEWSGDERCCGFGGLFSVKQPELSVAMADDKLDSLAATGAEMLVGSDQSCLMHLEGRMAKRPGPKVPVRHIAEVLADER